MDDNAERARRRRRLLSRRALRAWLRVRRAWRRVFGRLRWERPAWMERADRRVVAVRAALNRNPLTTLATLTLVVSLVLGTHWLLRHGKPPAPAPRQVVVKIDGPGAPDWSRGGAPRPLWVTFGTSAAPLAKVGKVVQQGIALEPPLAGRWRWASDRRLVFVPRQAWPIAQKMRVRLALGALAPGVLVDADKLRFETARFVARVRALRFHEDPRQPTDRRLIATLGFSHPVSLASLRERVTLQIGKRAVDQREVRVSLRADARRLQVFVTSESLSIPARDLPALLRVAAGVRAAAGGNPSAKLDARGQVPGIYSRLRVASVRSQVVERADRAPQHVLFVEANASLEAAALAKHLRVYLLPRIHPDDAKKKGAADAQPYSWSDPSRIGEDLLASSKRLALTPVEGASKDGRIHALRYRAPVGRWLYAVIARDMPSASGYRLGQAHTTTLVVPEVPARLKILSKGAILRLGGARRLAVYARNVDGVKLTLWRILPHQLHHHVRANRYSQLAAFTGGDVSSLSEVFHEQREITKVSSKSAAAARVRGTTVAFNVGRYLRHGGGVPRGVFVVEARALRRVKGKLQPAGTSERRAILVTDLGLLVKRVADGSRDVFVQSLSRGGPVAGASIEVLGPNGLAVARARTDERGHARLQALDKLPLVKLPGLYVVRHGADLTFMPYDRYDRRLDLSRFSTGGRVGAADPRSLDGFVFSDRGLYRPGETLRLGVMVKRADFGGDLSRLPLELTLSDPRGTVVARHKLRVDENGFAELSHDTSRTALSGRYTAELYIARDGKARGLLGSTTVRVRDFAADRLAIRAWLPSSGGAEWLRPSDLRARVSLRTLYGTAAAGRRVRARVVFSPGSPIFSNFPGYSFHDRRASRGYRRFARELGEVRTDKQGRAQFVLDAQSLLPGIYRVRFIAEAFEAGGGRSVVGEASTLVSSLKMVVGYKARKGALNMIPRKSRRTLHVVAVGRDGMARRAAGLVLERVRRAHVSVLTKQYDGSYAYQSVARETLVERRRVDIGAHGLDFALDTSKPGDYRLRLRNAEGEDLMLVSYGVAGEANVARSLERSAQLDVVLASGDVTAGQLLRVQVKGPYAGSGLITIERDRVHAFRWFRARKGSTVATIRVPRGLEGNAYVAVTLARDPRSSKVFASPLSYAVQPFSISRRRRTLAIDLDTPKRLRPGQQLVVRYKAPRRGRVMLFAVDEGILRVARYSTPDPLSHFFRKRALQVLTEQTLDLVLPEARQLMRAPGGGADGDGADVPGGSRRNLNPFQRQRRAPVAFWSGVKAVGPRAREWRVTLPDHFDGTLRVMAVSASRAAVGSAARRVVSRGELVLSPSAPLFVAPGDTFVVGVAVSNQSAGSGKQAQVTLRLRPSKHLEVVGSPSRQLTVAERGDGVAHFTLRARDTLGAAQMTVEASLTGGGKHVTRRARLDTSVRPAAPRVTTVRTGVVRDGVVRVPLPRALYPEHRRQHAGISALPLGLAPALVGFLRDFPHGCTEQIVSQGWPALVMLSRSARAGAAGKTLDFAATHRARDPSESVRLLLARLARRQNSAGGFGLWASSPRTERFATVYALHFLVEAKRHDVTLPPGLLDRGLRWARRELRRASDATIAEERLRAYAAYVLARAGRVVGGEVAAIHQRLEKHHRGYAHDLAAVYLAATYKLLRQHTLAKELIEKAVDFGRTRVPDYQAYYDALIHDAQLLHLLAEHFPRRAAKVSAAAIRALVGALGRGRYNTLSAAYTVLALDSYSRAARRQGVQGRFSLSEVDASGRASALSLPRALLPLVSFSGAARALSFEARGGFEGFYSVLQSGYDRGAPRQVIRRGLEVHREYIDAAGRPLAGRGVRLGESVYVRVRLRSTDKRVHRRVAIVDLLPGGFEVPRSIVAPDALVQGRRLHLDYVDTREDRVVLYTTARPLVHTTVYRLQATSAGRFAVAPIKAESMYDRSLVGRSSAGVIKIMHKMR